MSLGVLAPDTPARVYGFVTPFGFAPPDFVGRTLVDFSAIRAELGIGWGVTGTGAPFLAMGADGLVVNTTNPDLGLRHHIRIGWRIIDITALASPLTVAPAAGRTLFAIGTPDGVQVFREWAPFVEGVTAKLAVDGRVRGMYARGSFDAGSATLTANYVAIVF